MASKKIWLEQGLLPVGCTKLRVLPGGVDLYSSRPPWPTKAAHKQHFALNDAESLEGEDERDRDDTEGCEFLSDEEVEDMKVPKQSDSLLFKSEDD